MLAAINFLSGLNSPTLFFPPTGVGRRSCGEIAATGRSGFAPFIHGNRMKNWLFSRTFQPDFKNPAMIMGNSTAFLGKIMSVYAPICCAGTTWPENFRKFFNLFNWLMLKTTNLHWLNATAILESRVLELSEMLKHPLKIAVAVLTLTVALASGNGMQAHAFTETKVPPPLAGQPAPSFSDPKLQLQKPETGTGLELSTPGDGKSGGTELAIPGVGTIGTIPKLDFGLELLYGANGSQTPENNVPDEKTDDVLIKGTIKHRF